jgi:hypothetical protein
MFEIWNNYSALPNGDTLKKLALLNFEPAPTLNDTRVFLSGLQALYPSFTGSRRRLLASTVNVSSFL